MPVIQPEGYLTTAQVASMLRTTQGTVSTWARQGRIAATRVEGRWFIHADSIQPILERDRQAQSWRAQPTPARARTRQSAATTHLVHVAGWWRDHPNDPDAIAALIAAVDARTALIMKTSPGPLESS